jgi:hypothetical protein
MFGSAGLRAFMSEYKLAPIDSTSLRLATRSLKDIELRSGAVPGKASREMSFRARHLIPLLSADIEQRKSIFAA